MDGRTERVVGTAGLFEDGGCVVERMVRVSWKNSFMRCYVGLVGRQMELWDANRIMTACPQLNTTLKLSECMVNSFEHTLASWHAQRLFESSL
jgi:hypothetical protein